jgi:hypothetical protein
MIAPEKDSVEWYGSEENEPQINADERRFVASNPSLFIDPGDFSLLLFLSFSCVVTSSTFRRVEFLCFSCYYFSEAVAINLHLSAFICLRQD